MSLRASLRLVALMLAAAPITAAADAVGTAPAPLPVYTLVDGSERAHAIARGDSASALAGRYTMDPELLRALNPGVNVDRVKVGRSVQISDRHIVPQLVSDGLVIDIADRTLYWFEAGALKARFPVAVGRNGRWPTPQGWFYIQERRRDPVWRVPKSIQDEMRASGKSVQTRVPPGPKNPLGKYFIALSAAGVGLHGTTSPSSVGRFATHGCMRMNEADVERLFHETYDGMPVAIVYQPISVAHDPEGRVWLEVHDDVYRNRKPDPARIRATFEAAGLAGQVDWTRVQQAITRRWGTAEDVTRAGAPLHVAGAQPTTVVVPVVEAPAAAPPTAAVATDTH